MRALLNRSTRFDVHLPAHVRTFGQKEGLSFFVLNLSHSGLVMGSKERSAFQIHTLVEIDIENEIFKNIIHITGKIIRVAREKYDYTSYASIFGVKFSESEDLHGPLVQLLDHLGSSP